MGSQELAMQSLPDPIFWASQEKSEIGLGGYHVFTPRESVIATS